MSILLAHSIAGKSPRKRRLRVGVLLALRFTLLAFAGFMLGLDAAPVGQCG